MQKQKADLGVERSRYAFCFLHSGRVRKHRHMALT